MLYTRFLATKYAFEIFKDTIYSFKRFTIFDSMFKTKIKSTIILLFYFIILEKFPVLFIFEIRIWHSSLDASY